MKKILLIMIAFALFVSPLSLKATAAQSDIIRNDKTGIPDKGLYRAILKNLGKKENGTFTKKEAAKIKYLQAGGYGIKNFKGIGYLKNLQSLAIHDNKLTKLRGLTGLKKLRSLDVSCNRLKNLDGVKTLKNLRFLDVGMNKLKNLNGVGALKNLKHLAAASNRLTDISGVKKLTKLRWLNVAKNQLTKLPDLTKTKLKGAEFSSFAYNRLSRKELEKKLPKKLIKWEGTGDSTWFKDQVVLQNINKKIVLDTPKSFGEITTATKKITGTAHKNAYVCITLDEGDRQGIYFARVNNKGKFEFKDLSLEEYEGQELLMLSAYECYENSTPIFAIKSFIVKKD